MILKRTYMLFMVITLFFLVSINQVQAGLIQADYSSSGDNGAVYDTTSGFTWLDLTHTLGMSYQAALVFDSDYRYATNAEVEALFAMHFAGVVYSYDGSASGLSSSALLQAQAFKDLFGVYFSKAYGLYDDEDNTLRIAGASVFRVSGYVYGPEFTSNLDHFRARGFNAMGTYLIKKTEVNEPASASLFLSTLLLLGWWRHKNGVLVISAKIINLGKDKLIILIMDKIDSLKK